MDDPTYQTLTSYLHPGKYIGVSWDKGIIENNQSYNPGATWLHDELFSLLSFNSPHLKRVGVLVYDSYTSVANKDLPWYLDQLFAFAHAQYQRLGRFLLVLNFVGRGNKFSSASDGVQVLERELQKRIEGPVALEAYAGTHNTMYFTRLVW